MTPKNDSSAESAGRPGDPRPDNDNLPGELLGGDLVDPGSYEVAADETEAEELDAGGESTDADIDDEEQLEEAETVAALARSSRPQRKASGSAQVSRKGAPTPKAKARPASSRSGRTTPVSFARESVEELKKVVWPTWPQVQQYWVAVLVLVVVVIAYVGLLDLGLGAALLKLFG